MARRASCCSTRRERSQRWCCCRFDCCGPRRRRCRSALLAASRRRVCNPRCFFFAFEPRTPLYLHAPAPALASLPPAVCERTVALALLDHLRTLRAWAVALPSFLESAVIRCHPQVEDHLLSDGVHPPLEDHLPDGVLHPPKGGSAPRAPCITDVSLAHRLARMTLDLKVPGSSPFVAMFVECMKKCITTTDKCGHKFAVRYATKIIVVLAIIRNRSILHIIYD